MKREIFKVQTSLDKKTHLVYNKNRTYFGEYGFNKETFKFCGYKSYVRGWVNAEGLLVIEEKVKAQDW